MLLLGHVIRDRAWSWLDPGIRTGCGFLAVRRSLMIHKIDIVLSVFSADMWFWVDRRPGNQTILRSTTATATESV